MKKGLHIYKASAGAGKTYTLALNYLALIFGGKRSDTYREILAMTFTNKAAAEMKQRIIHFIFVLSESTHDDHSDLKENLEKRLERQLPRVTEQAALILEQMLHNFSDISILTLDKFIQQIIKSFAKELNFTQQFKIESNTESVYTEVIDQLMEALNDNEQLSSILEAHSIYKAQSGSNYKLEQELIRSARQLEKESSDAAVNALKKIDLNGFVLLIKHYENLYNSNLKQLADNARTFSKSLGSVELTYKDLKAYTVKIYQMGKADRESKSERILFTEKQLQSIEAYDFYAKSAQSHVKSGVDGIQELLKSILLDSQERVHQHLYLTNMLKGLYGTAVISEIDKLLKQVKREQQMLFFIDFNRLSAEIIRNEPVPFIFERTGNRYKHIMLDEFQDTSEAQWQNLLPLMLEVLSKGGMGLIVGDEKQAIYRWRNGNVEQFMALPEVILPINTEKGGHFNSNVLLPFFSDVTVLPYNYRSNRTIVEFNNSMFKDLGKTVSESYQKIYTQVAQTVARDEEGFITVIRYDKKHALDDSEMSFNLNQIFKRISEVQSQKFDLKDIAILVRTNSQAARVSEFLTAKHHLPVISSESLRIDGSPEVQTLLHFLKLLIEPNQKVYQLAVMKFYAESKNITYNTLIENFTDTKDKVLNVFIDQFLGQFKLNRFQKPGMSLTRFMHQLIQAFEFNHSQTHLQFFLDEVNTFDQDNLISINAFLSWWDQNRHKLNLVVPEDSNAVRVMTIHASKGLEFPICILPFINWPSSIKGDTWVEAKESKDIDSIMLSYNKSMTSTPLKNHYHSEQEKVILDNSNLLYVAMTRAEKEMHIICGEGIGKTVFNLATSHLTNSGMHYLAGAPVYKLESTTTPPVQELNIEPAIDLQIDFSIEAPKNWEVSEVMDDRVYGDLFHSIMAKICVKEDIPSALEKCIISEDPQDLNDLKEEIEMVVDHPLIRPFFKSDFIHYPERELIDKKHMAHRPDCIIEGKDKCVILEYKTGALHDKHEQQLRQYGKLLKEITEKNVELYLIYSRPLNVIKL